MKHKLLVSAQPGVYETERMIYRAYLESHPKLESTGGSAAEALGNFMLEFGGSVDVEVVI